MKIIYNNIIPFKGFKAINICGIVFVRKDVSRMTWIDYNHEKIHTEQMKEMLYIFFYLWYLIEWIIRLFRKGNAYRNISFEREAYTYEQSNNYCKNRKRFAWIDYLLY